MSWYCLSLNICPNIYDKYGMSITVNVLKFRTPSGLTDWSCWSLTTCQPLWVIFCHFQEKGRKEIEDIVEEMKVRNSKETGIGTKVKKWRNKNIPPCLTVNQYQLDAPVTLDTKWSNKMAYENSVDPDQTAPEGAVWSGSTLFAIPISILSNNCI